MEDRIAGVARRQHGIITRAQLLEAGLQPGAVKRRAASGRLTRVHRGVYLVGPILPELGREMAAILACGEAALLSHLSAAAVWGLLPTPAPSEPVDVIVVGGHNRNRPGIAVHRSTALAADERTRKAGIPLTSPARTLLDLAVHLTGRGLERAMARAENEHLVRRAELVAIVDRYAARPGAPALRALLTLKDGPAFTRSEAESRFLALIRQAGLPAPEVNVVVHGHEVDFFWQAARLAVEIDGYRFHSSRTRFESDRRHTARLAAHGIHVIRLTWQQVAEHGLPTAVQIGQALALAARP